VDLVQQFIRPDPAVHFRVDLAAHTEMSKAGSAQGGGKDPHPRRVFAFVRALDQTGAGSKRATNLCSAGKQRNHAHLPYAVRVEGCFSRSMSQSPPNKAIV